MIKILKKIKKEPYLTFYEKLEEAKKSGQKNVDAVCISSFSKEKNEINSRFVNLKFIDEENWIFFSNYQSIKAHEFKEFNKISATFFWQNTNTQIRIKAKIRKTDTLFNKNYFKTRDKKKNALAISSSQSMSIESFEDVEKKYDDVLKKSNLLDCPDYWGGYCFTPYYFEFWEGNKNRLNKRVVFEESRNKWDTYLLQP